MKWGKSEYKWRCFITWALSGVLCVLSCYFQGDKDGHDPSKDKSKAFREFEGSFPKLSLRDRAVHKWQKS